ncbi:MAG: ATP-binding cassette domain-containing protein [Gammaproteobacteria bacterium]|jgi:oligopeptide transport system ATP-binding protein|nr:ATP-binding cassette domain-containing protein [Gammaproteobacteria bacterium]
MTAPEPILSVRDLSVVFDVARRGAMPWTPKDKLKAVDNISFDLYSGQTLGVVGESGCGKSTLARAIIRMLPAETGQVLWFGQDLLTITDAAMKEKRRDLQMIFQDPLASLDPRMTIGEIVAEPLKTHFPRMSKNERAAKVLQVLEKVGILPNLINRYPHEFSGGQCQRIGIARALIINPKLIICDEPVSALDVSIQAQVINLLMELQSELGLSLVFIAHDLSVVKHISDRVMVLYLGNIVEFASSEDFYDRPLHPYAQALIASAPVPDPTVPKRLQDELIAGDLPSPINPPSGCVFRTRCRHATDICSEQKPVLDASNENHFVACHHWQQINARSA